MKTERLAKILKELKGAEQRVSDAAATFSGNEGADAYCLLPQLLSMIAGKLSPPSERFCFGEFVSSGRILQAIELQRHDGLATEEMIFESDRSITKINEFLSVATGASVSLLIYVLALTGRRCSDSINQVASFASQSLDRRLQYRAYQFILFYKSRTCVDTSMVRIRSREFRGEVTMGLRGSVSAVTTNKASA